MSHSEFIIKFLVYALFAGVFATLSFSGFLLLVNRFGLMKEDMVIALGSLITHTRKNAFRVGVIFHSFSGIFFSVIYTACFVLIGITDWSGLFLLGLLMGLLHGVIASVALVASIADYHPLEEYQQVNFGIAIMHVIAHVIYGGVMGAIIGWSTLII